MTRNNNQEQNRPCNAHLAHFDVGIKYNIESIYVKKPFIFYAFVTNNVC